MSHPFLDLQRERGELTRLFRDRLGHPLPNNKVYAQGVIDLTPLADAIISQGSIYTAVSNLLDRVIELERQISGIMEAAKYDPARLLPYLKYRFPEQWGLSSEEWRSSRQQYFGG